MAVITLNNIVFTEPATGTQYVSIFYKKLGDSDKFYITAGVHIPVSSDGEFLTESGDFTIEDLPEDEQWVVKTVLECNGNSAIGYLPETTTTTSTTTTSTSTTTTTTIPETTTSTTTSTTLPEATTTTTTLPPTTTTTTTSSSTTTTTTLPPTTTTTTTVPPTTTTTTTSVCNEITNVNWELYDNSNQT